MQLPGVNELLKMLRNMGDPARDFVILTQDDMYEPLRNEICEHFGLQPSGPRIEIAPTRRVFVLRLSSNARGFGGKVILFHPDVKDFMFLVLPMIINHDPCMFIEDRIITDRTEIRRELEGLPSKLCDVSLRLDEDGPTRSFGKAMASPKYPPGHPNYSPVSPKYPSNHPNYSPVSPKYPSNHPNYSPVSPEYYHFGGVAACPEPASF